MSDIKIKYLKWTHLKKLKPSIEELRRDLFGKPRNVLIDGDIYIKTVFKMQPETTES